MISSSATSFASTKTIPTLGESSPPGCSTHEPLRLVELMDPDTADLGITGGEPTLFKDDFIRLLLHIKDNLPRTSLHVLTNGRMFFYRRFAESVARVAHPDLMLGIPLYSDID